MKGKEEDRVSAFKEWNPTLREDRRDQTDNEESQNVAEKSSGAYRRKRSQRACA